MRMSPPFVNIEVRGAREINLIGANRLKSAGTIQS